MATLGKKIRIYDLARTSVPDQLDEKSKKKLQAEVTRLILEKAPKYGQDVKTASSSIDEGAAHSIIKEINIPGLLSGEQSAKVAEATKPATADSTKAAGRPLRIVRRITVSEQAEAAIERQEEKQEENQTANQTIEQINLPPISEEESQRKKGEQELQENIKDILTKNQKSNNYSRENITFKDMSNVSSIPLKPVQENPSLMQPYRVAKPTITTQGMGRKKKRQTVDEKPKTIKRPKLEVQEEGSKEITITKPMTVRELSQQIGVPETQVITYFFMKKIIKTVNDILEKDLIVEYLRSQSFTVHTEAKEESHEDLKTALAEDQSEGSLEKRPPVVTIMGHVDHGKTTLVDTIRKTKAKIVDRESGGITQHISTYRIEAEDFDGNIRKITILDTPGHEAFTAMRKRGASVTDIVVLIVAADDGVMPQTIECIRYIKDNDIPFVVAVNKIDKQGANPDRVLAQLAEYDIITQNYGGDVECSFVSGLTNKNIDDLLMKITMVADAELVEKIKSNPNRLAIGTVIEAELSRTKGPLATVLVQNGTLRKGDFIAAGGVFGRVKSLVDENGELTDFAEPSTAVQVLGLSGVPKAGDNFKAYETLKEARTDSETIADEQLEAKRFRGIYTFASEVKEGQEKELRIIIKADVQGSAEAIAHEINKLSTQEVLVKPISIESGSITSNDVQMAEQTKAVIVGFHVGSDTAATAKLAEKLGVTIKSYEIIYKLTEDLERAVLGLHEPEYQESKLGEIEIRKIFIIGSRNIAGSYVKQGRIVRNEIARVLREGVKIYEGKVDYLKRFKDDAKEVREGFECGLSFEKYNDLQEGDIVECWTIKEVAKTL